MVLPAAPPALPAAISNTLDRMPPNDLAAERAVLGSILLDPNRIDEVANSVKPEDFYSDAHGRLFACLLSMSGSGIPIDISLVVDRLRFSGSLEAIGGMAYLAELARSVGMPSRITHYAHVVLAHSMRRRIIRAAERALQNAYDQQVAVEACLMTAESAFGSIRTGKYEQNPQTFDNVLVDVVMQIDEILAGRLVPGIPTGLSTFDDRFGGVFSSELTILAARPSQGKTSMALQWATHAAQLGYVVYFATLEMDAVELGLKRLCTAAGVSNHKVRSNRITQEDQQRLVQAAQQISMPNLILHDWPEIRPHDILRAARRCKADIVFVDYLQIVTPPDRTKQRHEQVADVAKHLKIRVARELRIPVVACAQIGRQAEATKDQRPRLWHLRESGDIENNADVVALLWRPDEGICETYRDLGVEKKRTWDAELDIAKNRKGRTTPNKATRIRLDWNGAATQFRCSGEQGGEGDGEF